jgi:adenylylsulfate reductase subunit B
MPTFVHPDKCDGCQALDRPACMYICPNDLMVLDKSLGKAWNQEPDQCWECYACVKTCPQTAIEMRGYGDVVPLGAGLAPLRGTDSIIWTVKFRNSQTKRFRFPIRTTPWGSIEPHQGFQDASSDEVKKAGLCGQQKYLGVPELPVVKH